MYNRQFSIDFYCLNDCLCISLHSSFAILYYFIFIILNLNLVSRTFLSNYLQVQFCSIASVQNEIIFISVIQNTYAQQFCVVRFKHSIHFSQSKYINYFLSCYFICFILSVVSRNILSNKNYYLQVKFSFGLCCPITIIHNEICWQGIQRYVHANFYLFVLC